MQRISLGTTGLVAGLVISSVATGRLSAQATQDSTTQQLLQRIDALDQQTRITARKFELYQDSVANAAKSKPSVTAGAGGAGTRHAGDLACRLPLKSTEQIDYMGRRG